MAKNDTWIRLYRKTLDSNIFASAGLFHTFCYCLLKASWKAQHVPVNTGRGETVVTLQPGEFLFGRHVAAKELHTPGTTVSERMAKLAAMGVITRKTVTHYTVVTVVNWHLYQCDPMGGPSPNRHPTVTQPSPNRHIQEVVEDVEGKEPPPPTPSAGLWLAGELGTMGLMNTAVVVASVSDGVDDQTARRTADGLLALLREIVQQHGTEPAQRALAEMSAPLRDGQRPAKPSRLVSWLRPMAKRALKSWLAEQEQVAAAEARRQSAATAPKRREPRQWGGRAGALLKSRHSAAQDAKRDDGPMTGQEQARGEGAHA